MDRYLFVSDDLGVLITQDANGLLLEDQLYFNIQLKNNSGVIYYPVTRYRNLREMYVKINQLSGTSGVISPGLAYNVTINSGTFTLSANAAPSGYKGIDAYIDIYLATGATLSLSSPLVLKDTLVRDQINHCKVKFRISGEIEIYLDD